jgi:uncharacterized membrane protein
MSNAKNFFNEEQQKQIVAAIGRAELNTSGEIRVHIENKCKEDVVQTAIGIFKTLNMHKTNERNGVLFYLAVVDQKFAVIGDEGIDKKVPPGFWDNVKEVMKQAFVKQQFAEGLCEGINMAGLQLKQYFPYQSNDTDELSNDMSFGKQ